MNVNIKFLGAAQTVTGSKHLLDIDGFRLLIDCGLFQGLKELRLHNWEEFPVEASGIDAIVLTHAHIDHTGYLPKLYKEGFRGPIYCTQATQDLLPIMLEDSARLQEEDTEYALRKGFSKHEKPVPLYNMADARHIPPLLQGYRYGERIDLLPGKASLVFHDAGHIVGAAMLEIKLHGEQMSRTIVFSGDLGSYTDPLLPPPTALQNADVLIMESTYGNRSKPPGDPKEALAKAIEEAFSYDGCVLIPAFALGRTQNLLHFLKELFLEKRLKPCPVYVDSPMAIKITALYESHLETYKHHGEAFAQGDFFNFPSLHYCVEQELSKRLNELKSGAIIISASGMATGGRIVHHLYNRLPRPNDTLLFVGYQGAGTRGRRILNGETQIKMFGEMVPVKCRVKEIAGLSAHADRDELLRWVANFAKPPKRTFLVHGEQEGLDALAKALKTQFGWHCLVPNYLESFELFGGI